MEEVWKDITQHDLNPNSHFQTLTFQDFLSQPFTKVPSGGPTSAAISGGSYPGSPPPIGLSLNPGPIRPINNNVVVGPGPAGGQLIMHHQPFCLNNNNNNNNNNAVSFDHHEMGGGPVPRMGRKRWPESESSGGGGGGDRRHKRMIKNRESAARSRARKQAYTNELELEVAHLMEENARLKRQQQQICVAAASQVPKKHTLHRSATAPF